MEIRQHGIDRNSLIKPIRKNLPNSTSVSDISRILDNVVPDMMDNIPFANPPDIVSTEANNHALIERFFPHAQRARLVELAASIPLNDSVGVICNIGKKDNNTGHPHLFEITRTADNILLTFVDPEDSVGRHSAFKPRIVNLLAAKISTAGNYETELAVLRFRTPLMQSQDLKMANLHKITSSLIEDRGLPNILEDKKKEILFRLVSTPQGSEVQARYSAASEMERFVKGGKGSRMLEGKVKASKYNLERFITLLDSPEQFNRAFSQTKQEAMARYAALRYKFKKAA